MFGRKTKIFVLLACLLVIIPSCFLGYAYYRVTQDASNRIQKGAIDRIIASESPVYYDDGVTPIGVFFEKTHRKYIHYSDIPKTFVKALIAAEDRNFFYHRGFDLKAIIRALLANIKAGKVVQGGSTLSQQTAKNIFKREKKSYLAKLKELFQAFLFERKFTKQEIFEMYANQFFVTGYGKGLEIAALYFFNKDARDLNLVEAAFIAGSVKGPNRYNPFIKKTEAEKEKAERLARSRKDYVLSNMFKMNFITQEQYAEAKKKRVPFKEGKITYSLNVVLDYVREQLESDHFKSILQDQGVENIASSGIRIYTSINKEIQEAALTSLRSHLPVMDVRLNGYGAGNMSGMDREFLAKTLKKSNDNLPFLSRITHIDAEGEDARLVVSWDQGGGIIDYEGLRPMGQAWLKWAMGNQAVFSGKYVSSFLKNFHIGDLVPVQTISSCSDKSETKLILSKIPELEGGVIVIQNGMLRGMVGGFFNRFFNRAVDARRQLGSIFKPILYTAALQLNWNSLDPLPNMRDLFRFENTFYLPRPDHTPKSQKVSVAWAGAKSENLATVWLLYHLTDRLNMSEFRHITDLVGLGRKEGESYISYKKRIRDQHGVVVSRETLIEAAFEESKKEVESDVIFAGHEDILTKLPRLHLNSRYEMIEPKKLEEKEQLLSLDFNRFRRLNLTMKQKLHKINTLIKDFEQKETQEIRESLMQDLSNFFTTKCNAQETRIVYKESSSASYPCAMHPVTVQWMLDRSYPLTAGEIWVDALIPSGIIDLLQESMKKNYKKFFELKWYDLEVLSKIRDFRTLVNISYVVQLSRAMGISTKLDPVLSFPLGPNAISIAEAALAYQTIMSGCTYNLSDREGTAGVPVIRKIVDRDGEVLWENRQNPEKILSDRVSRIVTEILREVIEVGTGRAARDAVQVCFGEQDTKACVPIPCFGKTGTANRFTNSSFVGFVPAPGENSDRLETSHGYVIGSYVGYDDNRPMKGRNSAIYGASGALPLWIDTANAIVNSENYKKNLQPADLVFEPATTLLEGRLKGLRAVPVSPATGLLTRPSEGTPSSSLPKIFGEIEDLGDKWEFKRYFEPLKGKME